MVMTQTSLCHDVSARLCLLTTSVTKLLLSNLLVTTLFHWYREHLDRHTERHTDRQTSAGRVF